MSKKKRKLKKSYILCRKGMQGIYKSEISRYFTCIWVDTAREAELILLPIEKEGLSDEQQHLYEELNQSKYFCTFSAKALFKGDENLKMFFGELEETMQQIEKSFTNDGLDYGLEL